MRRAVLAVLCAVVLRCAASSLVINGEARDPSPEKPCFACHIACKDGRPYQFERQRMCVAGRYFEDVELIEREPGDQGAQDTYVAREWYRTQSGDRDWRRVGRYPAATIVFMRCKEYERQMKASLGDRAGEGDSALGTPPKGWQP